MANKIKGQIYLVPTPLIDGQLDSIPHSNREIVRNCRHFLVESLKMGRRHIKAMAPNFDFANSEIEELNKNTAPELLEVLLAPVIDGHNLCILPDAGSPAIADPGSNIIQLAHRKQIEVIPLSGPSSILLALMASGFNGQQFTFHGYLSRDKGKIKLDLKKLEQEAKKGVTQIFMETPYRNEALFEQVINAIGPDLLFCVACDLTGENSLIKTQSVAQWKKDQKPSLHKRPCIFLLAI